MTDAQYNKFNREFLPFCEHPNCMDTHGGVMSSLAIARCNVNA